MCGARYKDRSQDYGHFFVKIGGIYIYICLVCDAGYKDGSWDYGHNFVKIWGLSIYIS